MRRCITDLRLRYPPLTTYGAFTCEVIHIWLEYRSPIPMESRMAGNWMGMRPLRISAYRRGRSTVWPARITPAVNLGPRSVRFDRPRSIASLSMAERAPLDQRRIREHSCGLCVARTGSGHDGIAAG